MTSERYVMLTEEQRIKMYKRKPWKRLREVVLIRDKYVCQYFKRFGVYKTATTVHHLFPTKERPELFYDERNLISVCDEAHNILEDRTNSTLTDEGIKIQRLFARKRGIK